MKKLKDKQATHYCAVPEAKKRVFAPGIFPERERLIIQSAKKWVNGTQLKYYFFDNESDGEFLYFTNGEKEFSTWKGSEEEKEVVRNAFEVWKEIGIGLDFIETKDIEDAEIRIGFMKGDGAWSYLGRDILEQAQNKRTMNFGWDITRDIDTALHEIGHTLGFPHEHQNPNAGIVWDEEAVYKSLGNPPNNWSRETTYHNIIRKIKPDAVQGSDWDPNSIMHYPFGKGLIIEPKKYQGGVIPESGLSQRDISWVQTFYPEISSEDYVELVQGLSQDLNLTNEEQINFVFKPKSTRKYNINTFGEMDAVMVLFKKEKDGRLIYLSGDDDSGEEANAQIEHKLMKGDEYVIGLRRYYSNGESNPILIY